MKANPLGATMAEADHKMLQQAFYESPDYKTIIESNDKAIIVGRRGTGKSALFSRLKHLWSRNKGNAVSLALEEDEVIGLRFQLGLLGDKYSHIRAGSKIIWQYAFMLEALPPILDHYKTKDAEGYKLCSDHLNAWRKLKGGIVSKVNAKLRELFIEGSPVEKIIGSLARTLELAEVEKAFIECLELTRKDAYILIDKLDEGFEADSTGVGLVVGINMAALALKAKSERIFVCSFLRDNIFGSISRTDPDFSRNLEGYTLRLHWDEYHLLNMICNRMRVAFNLNHEKNLKVWDACTAEGISGSAGFKRCLQLTLYRPRDLLVLLNNAFYRAAKRGRTHIDNSDIKATALEVSQHRFNDLLKEYEEIVAGLQHVLVQFRDNGAYYSVRQAAAMIDKVRALESLKPHERQFYAIFSDNTEIVKMLHQIGFLGVKGENVSSYVFSHDGKNPIVTLSPDTKLMIHPCYWMALNIEGLDFDQRSAEEIYDDYDIAVHSETPELRSRKIGQLMAEYYKIPVGQDGAADFEDWCLKTVKTLFAGGLRNVELHPNKGATQRRDIIGTNLGATAAWKRILQDYGVRQAIFEVKNYEEAVGRDEARQMVGYLSGEYGRLGFIITRAPELELRRGAELDWVREMYHSKQCLIIKLTGEQLNKLLSKIRSPQKHNAPDDAIFNLIDRYVRLYISL